MLTLKDLCVQIGQFATQAAGLAVDSGHDPYDVVQLLPQRRVELRGHVHVFDGRLQRPLSPHDDPDRQAILRHGPTGDDRDAFQFGYQGQEPLTDLDGLPLELIIECPPVRSRWSGRTFRRARLAHHRVPYNAAAAATSPSRCYQAAWLRVHKGGI